MPSTLDDLLSRLRALEDELQAELAAKRREIQFAIEHKRIRFPLEVLNRQRLHKLGLWRYLRQSRWSVMLTAPLIYAGFIPFGLMDLFVTLYECICFPIYGIPRVRRSDFMVFDRAELPYLNAVEKFNCFYCSYGNGVAGFLREVAARTEQYWCPIKHARRVLSAHEGYLHYFEFGDAQTYREGLERLRRQYANEPRAPDSPSSDTAPPAP